MTNNQGIGVAFTIDCDAIIQNNLSPKLNNIGSFLIAYVVRTMSFEKTLCDLGGNVNLMPLSMCKKLDLHEMKPTNISLQLAYWSVKYLVGILGDMSVRIEQLFIPIDFIIVQIEGDSQIPIILDRHFLSITSAIIN